MKYLKYYYNKVATMSYTAELLHVIAKAFFCTVPVMENITTTQTMLQGCKKVWGQTTSDLRWIYLQALIDSTLMTLPNGVWSLGSC